MSTNHFSVKQHVVPAQHIRNYAKSLAKSQQDLLSLAVKQYIPHGYQPRPGDVTIISSHSSGFPKEMYEPLWDALFEHSSQQGSRSFRIKSIWVADVVNQGDSGVLNEAKLGNEPSYFDSARDLLLTVNHFRDEMPTPLIGFGHSMGGTVLINLALLHPRLFTTVIAIEPIIKCDQKEQDFMASYSLSYKQDSWPSEEAARASVRRNPFYRGWSPRVLDLFLAHSLRPAGPKSSLATAGLGATLPLSNAAPASTDNAAPSRPVTLKTTRDQETLSYARSAYPSSRSQPLESWTPVRRTHPDLGDERNRTSAFHKPESYLTYLQLPFLRPSCHYIYGANTHLVTSQAKERELKLKTSGTATGGSGGAAEGRVTQMVVKGVGHFLPFEKPEIVAQAAGDWMGKELQKWRVEEGDDAAIWGKIEVENRAKLEPDWHFWQEKQHGERARKMVEQAKKRKQAKDAKAKAEADKKDGQDRAKL